MQNSLLPELKNCPFCNCTDIRIEGDDDEKYLWRWCGVYCSSCGVTYSRKNLPSDSGRQSAIKSWNTRVDNTAQLREALELFIPFKMNCDIEALQGGDMQLQAAILKAETALAGK